MTSGSCAAGGHRDERDAPRSGTPSCPCSTSSDSGVDIEQIADAVGHINSTVTKAVYRPQIARNKVTSAATVMDSIFGEANGS